MMMTKKKTSKDHKRRGVALLSSGIDSPVAVYIAAKQGFFIDALHSFHPRFSIINH